jgi:hypothetical protein
VSALTESQPPRGAIVVVAVGLVACVAAWLLSTDEVGGSSVAIEWAQRAPLPNSQPAAIPGGGAMRLEEGGLRATETNVNGERIYRATSVLLIEAGSAVGQARVNCMMRGGQGAELGRTVDSRGAFPRSSGEYNLTKQEVPGSVGVRLPIQGAEFASVEMGDAFDTFTNTPGVVVSWLPYRTASQEWQWGLPEGRPQAPITLGFATFWRATGEPSVDASCTLETGAGKATVRSGGELRR